MYIINYYIPCVTKHIRKDQCKKWEIKYLQYSNDLLRFGEDNNRGVIAVCEAQDSECRRGRGLIAIPGTRVQKRRAASRRSVLCCELHALLFLSLITEPYPNHILLEI